MRLGWGVKVFWINGEEKEEGKEVEIVILISTYPLRRLLVSHSNL